MSEHFDPVAGCRCGSCLELRGYVEQAEVWQARAAQAEARVAELEEEVRRAVARLENIQPSAALRGLKKALGGPAHA